MGKLRFVILLGLFIISSMCYSNEVSLRLDPALVEMNKTVMLNLKNMGIEQYCKFDSAEVTRLTYVLNSLFSGANSPPIGSDDGTTVTSRALNLNEHTRLNYMGHIKGILDENGICPFANYYNHSDEIWSMIDKSVPSNGFCSTTRMYCPALYDACIKERGDLNFCAFLNK